MTRIEAIGTRATSFIIAFVVLATLLGTFATIQSDRATAAARNVTAHVASVAACNAQYNMLDQARSVALSTLNQEQIDATNMVIVAVATAKDAADVTTALASFLAEQKRIAVEKSEHPVPPPPQLLCK